MEGKEQGKGNPEAKGMIGRAWSGRRMRLAQSLTPQAARGAVGRESLSRSALLLLCAAAAAACFSLSLP